MLSFCQYFGVDCDVVDIAINVVQDLEDLVLPTLHYAPPR